MTSEETIKEKLGELAQAISPDEALIENVMSRLDTKTTAEFSAVTTQNIWRTIMKSPITKLATAAAIIIAAVSLITILDKSATPAYGITDVPGLFKKAKAIHIQGWIHFNLTDKGKKVPKAPVERWIDLENGRARFTGTLVNASPEQVKVTIKETVLSGQYKMVLYHGRKQAVFYRMSDYQRMLKTHDCLQDMFGRLFDKIEDLNNIVKTGQEEIDGVAYDIWTCEFKETASDLERINRYKYWLSPTTGESGRFQSWYKNGEEPWRLGHDYYEIERDVDIPEGIFAMEIPEGYEAINSKDTAGPLELDEQGYLGTRGLALDARISFTLSDGSVILGWRGVDTESTVSQRELFEQLKFGGALPRLPVEVYALKPLGWTGNTTYAARHLAYTQKGDELIEWSLYVPDGLWPKRSEMFGYELLCKVNSERQMGQWPGMSVDYGIKIETEEDFDKWIRGAMAELSNDGKAPEGVTYERVLQLTEQVREPFAK
ncbi:MAG TPA: hypothetical protein DIU00_22995 [Phycisphaerales bacterium]|nr:hypothetical protein [Phycisphaerales bacterium]